MSDRWKMNRIGFVNFWLYDEEDFEFVDGKLLLRGQNGSGKSITTQSFIPFVQDDRNRTACKARKTDGLLGICALRWKKNWI